LVLEMLSGVWDTKNSASIFSQNANAPLPRRWHFARRTSRKRNSSFSWRLDAALDGYSRHAQYVGDFGFLQAGSIVFEGQAIELFIDVEAPQAIRVRELPEGSELLGTKRTLQVVGYFDEGHAAIIATPGLACGTTPSSLHLSEA
jgi:hypothetical protein